ncbi:MAG TPA: c-type cytochrome [Candidatus Tumulicola sp.]|jgi:thiosulfate dehydrogenase
MRLKLRLLLVLVAAAVAGACSSGPPPSAGFDPRALPTGPLGQSIQYGHDIVVDTQHLMKGYVRARMSCEACHLDAGTRAKGGSFVGTYGRFPQWNARAHRTIALQDRLAECFLYSMNGRPPAYASKPMIAMVAYIAWLSRGTTVGMAQKPADRYIEPLPSRSPDLKRGSALYAQKCAACHQTNGNGIAGAFPPLWGRLSFNDGAGMSHVNRMTGFVRYNMPQNAPGSLTLDDAYDVSAFVLVHRRPHFEPKVSIRTSPRPAGFF